jgi:hypothetical protein
MRPRRSCATAANGFLARLAVTNPYSIVYLLGIGLILVAPAVIGIFWGAPLIARRSSADLVLSVSSWG